MDYKKHYELLIQTRKDRTIDNSKYYECHHIIPRSMGGSNHKNNLIYLTAREHFIAHWLLWRIYSNRQMAFAFFSMCYMSKNKIIVSSRAFEESKLARREFIIENNKKYHKGKKLTPDQIKIISDRFKGVSKSDEHRFKISKALKGKKKSQSHKDKLSERLTGFDWSMYSERNAKISASNSGSGNGRSRCVYKYDENINLVCEFDTMKEALENLNQKMSKSTFYRYIISKKKIGVFIYSFDILKNN